MDLKSSDIFSSSETSPTPLNPRAYFIGVPAPLAAILVLLPIYCSLISGGINMPKIMYNLEAIYMIIIAGFTVSTLKTFSLKAIRFNPKSSLMVIFSIGLIAALLFSYTWLGLILLCVFYLIYLFWVFFKTIFKSYKYKKIA
jgi:CDP-diacylglycerol--serine O-phosphatidyltransferase